MEDLYMVSGLRHWTAAELRSRSLQEHQSRHHAPFSAREPSKREQEKAAEEKRRRAQCKVELEQYLERKMEAEAAEREAEQAEKLAKKEAERKREQKRRARQRELLKKMEEDGQRSQEIERMKHEDEAERNRMRLEAEQQKEQYRQRQKKQLERWLMEGADDVAERRTKAQAKHADIVEQTRLRHLELVEKNARQMEALDRMQQQHERNSEWKEALRGGPAEPSRGSAPPKEVTAKPSRRHSVSRDSSDEARPRENQHEFTRRPLTNNDWRSKAAAVSNMYGLNENQTSAVMRGIRGAGRMAVYCSPAPRPRPRHSQPDHTSRGPMQVGAHQGLAQNGGTHSDGECDRANFERGSPASDHLDLRLRTMFADEEGGALHADSEQQRAKSELSVGAVSYDTQGEKPKPANSGGASQSYTSEHQEDSEADELSEALTQGSDDFEDEGESSEDDGDQSGTGGSVDDQASYSSDDDS